MDFKALLNAARFRPNRLSFPESWIGHIPFAAWVMQILNPSIFVELGTHSGNSYLAFCQAVYEGGLSTKCYAVDTWQGDEHAGYYDEAVFQNLYWYHQKHYEAFSRLLRLTFDDASLYFADGSIDLLHIDGLHSYEAVKHDFEIWLPKLTPHAVVLFHDTNVREREFGVWRFWEELCAQYPLHLEFIHSHGLGVLQLSQGKETFDLEWLRPESQHRQLLLDFFSTTGQHIGEQYQTQTLEQISAKKEQTIQALTAQIAEIEKVRVRQVDELTAQIVKIEKMRVQHEHEAQALEKQVAEKELEVQAIAIQQEQGGQALAAQATSISIQLYEREQVLQALNAKLWEIYNSRAWRIIQLLWKVRLALIPPNSLRARIARQFYRTARQSYNLITSPKRVIEQNLRIKRDIDLIKKSGLFDVDWYLTNNPDIADKKLDPIKHYLSYGGFEGRNPGPGFYSAWYLDTYNDVRESGLNPLVHYLKFGRGEGRSIPVLPQPIRATVRPPIANRASFASDINLLTSLEPFVSIIISIYGKCDYTLRCLSSVAANPPSIPFEIIVINDCSPDDSANILQKVRGIRIISNKENQGFIRSCNIGANVAVGQYLYFLNNDTEVTSGWLDELVRTFHEFPNTGLAGSKLVYPNGILQEAGGIIWQDGSAWNFGRNQNQLLPIYNYVREVDYCSGASIMIPKFLFEELGGFDEHYLPAYCEDSDLALKIRGRGYRVIYQPLSIIVHYEGISSGKDTTQGVKAYQIENLKKQYQRWEKRLASHQAPGTEVDAAKDRVAKRRVLVVDHCTPTPDQDAGSVVTFNVMLLLREMGFQVTFIPEDNFIYMPDYTPALQRAGIEVLYLPYCTSVEQHLKEYGRRYDLAFLFRPRVVEKHIDIIRKYSPQAKVLFHTVDLHYLRMFREAELLNDKIKMRAADDMKQKEFAAFHAVDASIVVSTAELELLRSELPNELIHMFPLVMDISGTDKAFKDRRNVVFVGGYQHTPNIDAVKYFVNDVMPILRLRLPGVRFFVIGSKPPVEIQTLASEDVIIAGFVENLQPLLDLMRINVAPLRYGAGIKGKIGHAMAMGLPTVATSLAVEGMSLIDGENILVADGAEAFADAIVRLYNDESLWNNLSKSGLNYAEKAWGAETAWKVLNSILSDIGLSSIRGDRPLSLYSPHFEYLAFAGKNIRYQQNLDAFVPVATIRNKKEFENALSLDIFGEIKNIENKLIDSANADYFTVNGFCVPCNRKVSFVVDMRAGGQRSGQRWIPNWRERLECPRCHMNNRQRLVATLIEQLLSSQGSNESRIYFMEQVTPIFHWAVTTFPRHKMIGSEYLGYEYLGGSIVKGIRHEDVMNLSFEDNSFDFIVSNEVFEHVPDPNKAFSECARVLRSGGMMLATFPFHQNRDSSTIRAKINASEVEYLLPPMYHGNPVSADGSLVFTDFGWDVLDNLRAAGFAEIEVEIYMSAEYGHLGDGQLVFKAIKGQLPAAN